ncbi:DUF1127 domain-containing protein [Seohaeicola saemankumensis]|nr:DUF1127 domain-containing protein [Seohaeicola saemankumensis]MCA0873227.1 DUF1127 domain-containing protein [Seohaeicola saemankumensis]
MTFTTSSHSTARSSARRTTPLGRLFGIWRQRQALRRLDADALRDIGVTRAQAETEARRPFWDAPDTWRS